MKFLSTSGRLWWDHFSIHPKHFFYFFFFLVSVIPRRALSYQFWILLLANFGEKRLKWCFVQKFNPRIVFVAIRQKWFWIHALKRRMKSINPFCFLCYKIKRLIQHGFHNRMLYLRHFLKPLSSLMLVFYIVHICTINKQVKQKIDTIYRYLLLPVSGILYCRFFLWW